VAGVVGATVVVRELTTGTTANALGTVASPAISAIPAISNWARLNLSLNDPEDKDIIDFLFVEQTKTKNT
jgi:hypothetical protein